MNVTWHLDTHDPTHVKRLAIGYAVGVAFVVVSIGVAATVRATVLPKEEEEQVVDVKLAATAEPPKPQPPPPPPPEAPKAQAPPGPAPRKAIVAPTAVPTEAPPESDKPVKPNRGQDEYADGKGGVIGGVAGGTGTALAPPPPAPSSAAPPPPPPPPPKPQGPVALTEDMTPPSALATPAPPYPADARSQGVEATVVVRFTISESGEVQNPTIVRGHPLFDAIVLQTVKSWRYKPASLDGKPVSVAKTVRIPFSIKN